MTKNRSAKAAKKSKAAKARKPAKPKATAIPVATNVLKEAPREKRRVAIVGSAPHRMDAPYHDSKWEIWGINDQWRWMPRFDVLFELHHPDKFTGDGKQQRQEWLKNHRGPQPIIMQREFEEIPKSLAYPIDEIRKLFRLNEDRDLYANNSISFVMAFALGQLQAGDEIGLWGVDMSTWLADGEYAHQRPSCEYFIGIAKGMGIGVTIATSSDLCTCRCLYAFGIETGDAPRIDEKRRGILVQKIADLKTEIAKTCEEGNSRVHDLQEKLAGYVGAHEQMTYDRQGEEVQG